MNEKKKYKIGDTVTVKSKEWYDENKNEHGYIVLPKWIFHKDYAEYCGQKMIIEHIETTRTYPVYKLKANNQTIYTEEIKHENQEPFFKMKECHLLWTDYMFD